MEQMGAARESMKATKMEGQGVRAGVDEEFSMTFRKER